MFDLTDVETDTGFGALPNGEYQVVAKAGELKTTKAGDGKYIKVEFEVIDGAFKGRKLWEQYNVANPNEVATNIGKANMKKFFLAAGATPAYMKTLTPESFAGKVVTLVLGTKEDAYGTKNIIKEYKSETGKKTTPPPTKAAF